METENFLVEVTRMECSDYSIARVKQSRERQKKKTGNPKGGEEWEGRKKQPISLF